MACPCSFFHLSSYKDGFFCGVGVGAVADCALVRSCFVMPRSAFYRDAVYSHVYEECGGGVRVWGAAN